MSGRKSNRNNTPNRRPNDPTPTRMTAVLDQLATDANTQRRDDPNMAALEPNLRALLAEFERLCGHLDEVTAGAALLVVGQLCAAFVNGQSEAEQKVEALAALPNLIRLVGAQLYAGTTTEVQIACPFTYLSGAACKTSYSAATQEHAELLMRGHVWQNHPGETWPLAEDADSDEAQSAIPERERLVHDDPALAEQIREGIAEAEAGETVGLGSFAEHLDGDGGVVDAVNLAPTDPAAQAAAIADLEAEFPDDGDGPEECAHPKDAREHLPGGERCSACGHWIGC